MYEGFISDEIKTDQLLKKLNQLSKKELKMTNFDLNLNNPMDQIDKIKEHILQFERDILAAIKNKVDIMIFMDLELELKNLLETNFHEFLR